MLHRLLLILITTALTAGAATDITSSNPSASVIFRRMAQAYSSCKSYRDTGTVTRVFQMSGNSYRSTLRFQTVFKRPNRFRFEYNSGKNDIEEAVRHVVWTSGSKAYSWWTIDSKTTEEESLDMAIAGATGVSSGSAHTVSRLLTPKDVSGWAMTQLEKPKLISEEPVNGIVCFKIAGSDAIGDAVTVWIEKRTYLIQKISVQFKQGQQVTTLYHPEINIELPESAFESRVKK